MSRKGKRVCTIYMPEKEMTVGLPGQGEETGKA